MDLGIQEIVLVLLVILLLFGGKRLPELARNLGRGLAEFRRATQAIQKDLQSTLTDDKPETRPQSQATQTSSSEVTKTEVHAHPASQPRAPEGLPGPDS